MRALLGLLILGSLFVMAASWQNRTTARLRDDRARRYNVASDAAFTEEGWSRLILGRPSGAVPLPVPEPVVGGGPGQESAGTGSSPGAGNGQGAGRTPPAPPVEVLYDSDKVYVVKPNDVLSRICQTYYDVRPLDTLVDRVATYNDLRSPDAIRTGDKIRLPDAAVLFPERSDIKR